MSATTSPTATPPDAAVNSGYGSGDETTSLLGGDGGGGSRSTPAVTVVPTAPSTKPVLMRQDCTTYPQLSGSSTLGGSQESGAGVYLEDTTTASTRSVPDIELHCRLGDGSAGGGSNSSGHYNHSAVIGPCGSSSTCRLRTSSAGYHLLPHAHSRCRCERRDSHSPIASLQPLARSVSRESIRSIGLHHHHHHSCSGNAPQPPQVLLTTSPYSSRIIRQSSQPESTCSGHIAHHHVHQPSSSLRQLREPGDGIAVIAADSLRINGAIRQFKQGILLNPQTLAQSRRSRLRRAFTDATSETLNYVKTNDIQNASPEFWMSAELLWRPG